MLRMIATTYPDTRLGTGKAHESDQNQSQKLHCIVVVVVDDDGFVVIWVLTFFLMSRSNLHWLFGFHNSVSIMCFSCNNDSS